MALLDHKNLGPKSEAQLTTIGIHSLEALHRRGAIGTFIDLKIQSPDSISLHLLYALSSALENRQWREIADNNNSGALLIELESTIDLIQPLDL
jgi:hypothetical protein